jgi:hypothetical protein
VEARKDGIQATKEVQIAAQRVLWENSRLRQILHDQGLDSSAINALIYKDGCLGPPLPDAGPLPPLKAAATTCTQIATVRQVGNCPSHNVIVELPNLGTLPTWYTGLTYLTACLPLGSTHWRPRARHARNSCLFFRYKRGILRTKGSAKEVVPRSCSFLSSSSSSSSSSCSLQDPYPPRGQPQRGYHADSGRGVRREKRVQRGG